MSKTYTLDPYILMSLLSVTTLRPDATTPPNIPTNTRPVKDHIAMIT